MCVILLFGSCYGSVGQNLLEETSLWSKPESRSDGRYHSKIFVYEPVCATSQMPAIIVLPGGSYTYLAINSEGHDVAAYFASKGFVAIVLRYRIGFFGARYPQHLEDYRKTMDYIRANAPRLGIDTSRIGVVGFSAGGHLAGCAAMLETGRYRPDFAGMIYPVVTMREPYVHHPSKKHLLRGRDFLEDSLSLELHVNKDISPIFLLHCKDDPIVMVQGSENFASELERKEVNCRVEIHDTGRHGFGVRAPKGSGAVLWQERFIEWLHGSVFR